MQIKGIRPWLRQEMEKGRLYVTLAELRSAFPEQTEANLKSSLTRASADNIIANGWQGFYLLLPASYAKRRGLPPGLYIDGLMRYLGKPYCVGLLSAAEIYGAAHQQPMTFTVMTSNPPPRNRRNSNSELVFVAKREFNKGIPDELLRKIKIKTGYLSVSTPEFTALSLLQYPKVSGGLSHVLTVLEELLETCDFSRLPDCIGEYIPISCFQRLGYMSECILKNHTIGEQLHLHLIRHSKGRYQAIRLDSSAPREKKGFYSKRWKIHINTHLVSDSDDT